MPDPGKLSDTQKKALLAKERAAARVLIDEYRRVWQRILADLDVLAQQMRQARLAGEQINAAWLAQRDRLKALLAQIEGEIQLTAHQLEHLITQAQAEAVIAGQQDAADLIKASLPAEMLFQPAFPTLAFQQLVGFAQDGQPLGDLLAELGPLASAEVKKALVIGVGLGKNPRTIAYDARTALGGNLARAMTIARTEVLRAYRESTRATYVANSHVVQDWVWYAKLDARTCPVCWAMSGQTFEVEIEMETHPNCRCALIPRTRSWDELGFHDLADSRPVIPLGEDLFAQADPELQRQVLGPSKFAAYKAGDITLADLVQKTSSSRWGGGRREASLATALAINS